MTESELTKLVLKCIDALADSKDLGLHLTYTSYTDGQKEIIYHIDKDRGEKYREININIPLSILEQINTKDDIVALGQSIIARIYLQTK